MWRRTLRERKPLQQVMYKEAEGFFGIIVDGKTDPLPMDELTLQEIVDDPETIGQLLEDVVGVDEFELVLVLTVPDAKVCRQDLRWCDEKPFFAYECMTCPERECE